MALPQDCDSEITEDIPHQRLEWAIERAAWVLMAVILVASLLGLLGSGPLSSRTLAMPESGLQVSYERFGRHRSPTSFTLGISAGSRQGDTVRLALGREFLDRNEIERIEPEPETVEAWPDHNTYVFNLPSAEGPVQVRFYYEPDGFGTVPVRMQLEPYQELVFSQFIYP